MELTKAIEFSSLDFHRGRTILQLSGKYPRLLQMVLEIIQNSLDVEATQIWIRINQRERTITIRDNGNGVGKEKFEEALTQVAQTMKDRTKMGQFGIGLITPIGKCNVFTFTSCPSPAKREYKRWTFVSEDIIGTKGDIKVPIEDVTFVYDPSRIGTGGASYVNWRTETVITGYTQDATISALSMNSLVQDIRDRFSVVMRRNKVLIDIRIITKSGETLNEQMRATEFLGKKLEPWHCHSADAGRISFHLYVPRKGNKKRGVVLMGERNNDFRFPAVNFVRSLLNRNTDIDRVALETLVGGQFEGYVVADRVELKTERTNFVPNDAFFDLARGIERWYLEVGADLVKDRDDEVKFRRYQDLGLKYLQRFQNLLQLPEFSNLRALIKGFSFGSVGDEHADVPTSTRKVQEDRSKAVIGAKQKNGSEAGETRDRKTPDEHPDHTPLTVTGPDGRRRTIVRDNSTGLQFSFEEFLTSTKLFALDTSMGVLRFNIRHPMWEQCEKEDRWLLRLQEEVCIIALTRELFDNESSVHIDLFTEEQLKYVVLSITNS